MTEKKLIPRVGDRVIVKLSGRLREVDDFEGRLLVRPVEQVTT